MEDSAAAAIGIFGAAAELNDRCYGEEKLELRQEPKERYYVVAIPTR